MTKTDAETPADPAGSPVLPSRPRLAFRVGVTGTREFHGDTLATIQSQVRDVLLAIRSQVDCIAGSDAALGVYALTEGVVEPHLRIVSPLAEGADRLVAHEATVLGYALDIVLPFPREDYARDFSEPESRAEFERWLGPEDALVAPPILALDGGRGQDETRSYEAVGRLVVRNCDLLIAVWDGQIARGRGGTAEIVRYSARFGPPVWWIDATGCAPPRLVTKAAQLRAPETLKAGADATHALGNLLCLALLPEVQPVHRHGLFGWVIDRMHALLDWDDDPYHTYLTETPRPKRRIWNVYRHFLRVFGGPPRPEEPGLPQPAEAAAVDPSAAYWEALYRPADRGSTDYGDRYRSSYVMVFALAMLAATCAVVALAWLGAKPYATLVELPTLVLILWLVLLNQRRHWHRRWLAYRLLAELCRKQGALALLGWSLPSSNLKRFDARAEAWVGWYFNAAQRAAPLPRGRFTPERLESIKAQVRARLLAGQAQYHEDREERSARAARRLALSGEGFFLVTLIAVIVKSVLLIGHLLAVEEGHAHDGPFEPLLLLGVFAAIVPAASAALLGLRAYGEFELLEQQSGRMKKVMEEATKNLDTIHLDRPLGSQDLAAELFDVATEMLRDVGGWADLFRVKAVEAG